MTNLTLSIERIVVETEVEREAAVRIPELLTAAFQDLAERWARSTWARQVPLAQVVRAALETETISAEELLGARGAERLSERWWQTLAAELTRVSTEEQT